MKISRFTYTVIIVSVTIILLALGFYLGFTNMKVKENQAKVSKENIEKEQSKENTVQTNVKPVEDSEPVVDVEVIYSDYYIKCNHSVEDKINTFGARISDIKKEHEESKEKKEYEITEQTDTKIVFTKKHDSFCNEHYLVKIEDGKVIVYNNVNDGIYPLYKETNIAEERIRDALKTELKKGIFVNSNKELFSLLEDAES